MEIWKPVVGLEGIYEISNLGNVKSIDRITIGINGIKQHRKGKMLSFHYNRKGYKRVQLGKYGVKVVHQLVAKAFIPNPENKPQVNHIDGNKENNSSDNLEWVTMKENLDHAWREGLRNVDSFHKYNSSRARRVSQFSLDGSFIRSFDSLQEAARQSNDYASNIRDVCLDKRQKSKGFIYRFV